MSLRVLAAMSGGVDSAVAAARAVEAGHDVTGVHLALAKNPRSYRSGARGCCTVEDSRDARRAADVIGIPFYVWDMAEEFDRDVVQDFVDSYAAGVTPNPCLRCNEKIKFAAVLDRAVALGFDAVCTGHHARLVEGRLVRSADEAKDQSYVLAVLRREQLAHAMFPLGDMTKDEVRTEAARRELAVAQKPDSHDICFIPDGDTAAFLTDRLGSEAGPVVDESGEVVGTHGGAHQFTVGQRRGLELSGAPHRRYVLSIEPVENTVTVGPAAALEITEIVAERPVWSGMEPTETPLACQVQLRAHGEIYPCRAWESSGELVIELEQPVRGVAPGQAAVLYGSSAVAVGEGDAAPGDATADTATADTVLACATIARTRNTHRDQEPVAG